MMSLCNRYQAIFRHGPISIVPYSNPKGEAVKSLTSRLTLDQSKQIVLEANVLIPQLMQNNIDQASDKSLRDARRLLQQLSQIDLAAFENVPDPAAAARALRTNLETFINAYYASMREYFKNPLEAEYHPVGIVSNGALNCAYAAFVQIEANNKLLRRSLSEKQTMQAALERYSAASTDTPVPIDLEAIRNSLSGHLDAQASRQHDASEIAIRMYEGIGPTENGLVPLRDGPQQFYVSSSERVSDAGGGVPGWRDICEPGAQQATLRPPIIQVNYNLDALQNKSVLSLEDCLAQSYSADETAAPGLKKLGQQPATLLVGVARPYNGGRLDATPIDAPLYCQPEELFGLKQDPNDPNSAQYYTLQGFISYSGNSMNGHYVAYIQCGDEFYCLNGSTKTPVTQAVYLEKATRAVLLNYSQVVPKQRP
jgi:hypothetical protein